MSIFGALFMGAMGVMIANDYQCVDQCPCTDPVLSLLS